jgi:type IV pilus assembly protein PilW
MIALVLSLMLAIGTTQLFISNKTSYKTSETISRIQENARYAMQRIGEDLSAGGYMGCVPNSGSETITNTLGLNANTINNFLLAIDATAADSFTIRKAGAGSSIPLTASMPSQTSPIQLDNTDPDYAQLEQYQILTVGDCSHASVFMITNNPATSGGTIEHLTGVSAPAGGINPGQFNSSQDLGNRYGSELDSVATSFSTITSTYSIGNSTIATQSGNNCNNGANPQFCALLQNGNELVEGVQGLNLLFGMDTDGDLVAENYVNNAGVTNWANVISARVTLDMNSVQPLPDGNLMTKSISNTFRLRNRAMR